MRAPLSLISTRRFAQVFGYALLALCVYLALTASVLCLSLVLLRYRITTGVPWVWAVQEHIYFTGARNIWGAQPACVSFDEELVYEPRIGSCHFDNPEFSSVQTFSREGRDTGPKPPGVGIAVVGDSHAMGWGVDDEETFAARLQALTGRPVYNLAVASYGTNRELVRLDRSRLLDRVDTVVIQYCENDLDENINWKPPSPEEAREKFSIILQAAANRKTTFGSVKHLNDAFWFTFWRPYSGLKERIVGRTVLSFAEHYEPLISTMRAHPALANKRVLVFSSNSRGSKFSDFPVGRDRQLPYVEFIDPNVPRAYYYRLDGHPTSTGQQMIANYLAHLLQPANNGRR